MAQLVVSREVTGNPFSAPASIGGLENSIVQNRTKPACLAAKNDLHSFSVSAAWFRITPHNLIVPFDYSH